MLTIAQAKQLLVGSCLGKIERIAEIPQGLSHQSFKVTTATGDYVAKYFDDSQVGNNAECCGAKFAQQIGVGVEVVFSNAQWLVTRFIEHIPLDKAEHSIEQRLALALKQVASFHSESKKQLNKLSPHLPMLNLADVISELLTPIEDQVNVALIQKLVSDNLADDALLIGQQETLNEKNLVAVHGDLNWSNLLVSFCGSLNIIDFSACSIAEPEYDLAMLMAVNELSLTMLSPITKIYSQYAILSEYSQKNTMKNVTRYYKISLVINGLWYFQQFLNRQEDIYLSKAKTQFQLLNKCEKANHSYLL